MIGMQLTAAVGAESSSRLIAIKQEFLLLEKVKKVARAESRRLLFLQPGRNKTTSQEFGRQGGDND